MSGGSRVSIPGGRSRTSRRSPATTATRRSTQCSRSAAWIPTRPPRSSSSKIIFGNRWRHLLGERDFWEHIGGVDISLDPSRFDQANTAFNLLLRKLQKSVPFGSAVVDLYAGSGVIGLSVAATRKCRSLKCVEINKESKLYFEKSISRLPKTIDSSISWHNTEASIEPLHWLEGSDVIVVDPPRKGLHPSLVDALQKIAVLDKKAYKMPGSPQLRRWWQRWLWWPV